MCIGWLDWLYRLAYISSENDLTERENEGGGYTALSKPDALHPTSRPTHSPKLELSCRIQA